jgi:hypothetical protein
MRAVSVFAKESWQAFQAGATRWRNSVAAESEYRRPGSLLRFIATASAAAVAAVAAAAGPGVDAGALGSPEAMAPEINAKIQKPFRKSIRMPSFRARLTLAIPLQSDQRPGERQASERHHRQCPADGKPALAPQ